MLLKLFKGSVLDPSPNKIMLFTIRSAERVVNLPVIFLFINTTLPYFSHLQVSLFSICVNPNVDIKGVSVFSR